MNTNKNDIINLSMQPLQDSLDTKNSAHSLQSVIKESNKVTGYKLDNGQTISTAQAIQMAKKGDIKGVAVANNHGEEYLKSLPDSALSNNIDNLPTLS